MGGSRCKLLRPSESERGPGPEFITYVFVFSNLCRSRQNQDATDRFSDLVHGFLSGPLLLVGGGPRFFFLLWSEPAVSGPDVMSHI